MNLQDGERAGALAGAASAAFERMAEAAVVPNVWRAAGALFLRAFRDGGGADEIARDGEAVRSESTPMNNALRCVGYIGATLQAGVTPEKALVWHLQFARYVSEAFRRPPAAYNRCVVPYFREYWMAMLARARFRFGTPAQLDGSLADLGREPSRRRLQRLLTAVTDSLGVGIDASTREWLRGGG